MILLQFLLLFDSCLGQSLTVNDLHMRLTSMETKMTNLESEVKMLKTKNGDLQSQIELKEVQADVSFLMTEQTKLTDRIRVHGCKWIIWKGRFNKCIRGTLDFLEGELDLEPINRIDAIESEKSNKRIHEVSDDVNRSDDFLEIISGKG